MRVVMLTDDIMIDRRILQEAETLRGKGHEVILLAGWQEGLSEYELINGIKVHRVKSTNQALWFIPILLIQSLLIRIINLCAKFLYTFFSLTIRVLQKVIGLETVDHEILEKALFYDGDVYHSHDLPSLLAGCKAAKKLGVPFIYDAHELYPEIHTLTLHQQRRLSKLERKWIKRADVVITVNEFIAEEMGKRYKIALPKVILNAAQAEIGFDPENQKSIFRERFSIDLNEKIVIFHGWMAEGRGLDKLVRSMRLLDRHIHLVLMGYGDYREVLERLCHEVNSEDRIHFLDAVPQSELLYYISSADAGIIPYEPVDLNHQLCSPNKLFEFIQAGIPIIANDLPFLRKIIEGEEIGIVRKLEDEASYAEAIRAMFSSTEKFRYYKKNILGLSDIYCWDVEGKRLLEIYQQLLEQWEVRH